MSTATTDQEFTERRARERKRAVLVAALAALLCGGVMMYRVGRTASGGSSLDRAISALEQAGVELQTRTIPADVDVALERHPAQGGGKARVMGELRATAPVLLLNFWATWCPPCLDELASLQSMGRRLRADGVVIAAVSYDEDWAAQTAVFDRILGTKAPPGVVWLRDPAGQDGAEEAMMRIRMGTSKLPETWVIAGDQVLGRFVGEQDWSDPAIIRALQQVAEASR